MLRYIPLLVLRCSIILAILAQQGAFTIEHKTRIASQLNGRNERNGNTDLTSKPCVFGIIYDSEEEKDEDYYRSGNRNRSIINGSVSVEGSKQVPKQRQF